VLSKLIHALILDKRHDFHPQTFLLPLNVFRAALTRTSWRSPSQLV